MIEIPLSTTVIIALVASHQSLSAGVCYVIFISTMRTSVCWDFFSYSLSLAFDLVLYFKVIANVRACLIENLKYKPNVPSHNC
jgi:hypothetical protein